MSRSANPALALALGTAAFGAAMAGRHALNPWATNAVAALLAFTVAWPVLRGRLRELLAFRTGPALAAVGLGAVLVALTHLGFQVAIDLLPGLAPEVEELYQDINQNNPGWAATVVLIAVIAAAEETLWRGVAVDLCSARLSKWNTGVAATALYAVPQLVAGAPVLIMAAVVLGAVLTAQRLITGRLTEPLITHTIWSVSVFNLLPLS